MVSDMMRAESPSPDQPVPVEPACAPSLRAQAAADRERIDALADDIATCAARLQCVEHELLTYIRRFDELSGWSRQGARSAAEWLSWRIGIGRLTAREKVRVAVALGTLPKIDAALQRGELSYCKVRALTRVADADNQELLLAQARGSTGAELERICSGFRKIMRGQVIDGERRYVRRRFMQDGTVQIEMRLLPDEAERVWQALTEQQRALASGEALNVETEAASETETEAEAGTQTQTVSQVELDGQLQRGGPSGTGNVSAETPTMADAAVAMAERTLASTGSLDASAADRRLLFVHLSERRLSERRLSGAADAAGDTTNEASNSPHIDVGNDKTDTRSRPTGELWKAELQDGTAIQGESLLRLACDSGLIVAKTDAKGRVLDLGRRRRTVSPALMRALRLATNQASQRSSFRSWVSIHAVASVVTAAFAAPAASRLAQSALTHPPRSTLGPRP